MLRRLVQLQRRPPFRASHRLFSSASTAPDRPELLQCWKCGKHLCTPTPTERKRKQQNTTTPEDADHCGAVQPVLPWTNFFHVFGVDAAFAVDAGDLKMRFLALQQRVHPDANTLRSQNATFQNGQSVFINKAYQTLRDPLARAKYILHLNKIHVDESENKNGMSPTDLMKIMDVWEAIEEVETQDALDSLIQENEERIRKEVSELSQAFADGSLQKAKEATVRLQYWYSLRTRLRDVEL
ncbi:hypothetical protein BDR26DRAFT_861507 [Obelidium mucronatum]|nr:hypothetical protein BDR26DRAFT_861507 [Obelidium mucronatum]